jgi:Asp-tRNA(Asn)/Glu-tRNA(Gln) amidotransferase A subunit family amidase
MGALGSDTGGSIRIPSALCGIVGLKPTAGRVSRHGVFPLSWSLDTVGPMTRTVRDAALVLNAIAGHDPRDPTSSTEPVGDVAALLGQDVSGVRVGMPSEHFFDDLDSEVGEALSTAAGVLEGLGAAIDEVSVPAFEGSFDVAGTIMLAEAAEVHAENLRDRPDEFGPDLRSRLEQGAKTSAIDYIRAQRARRELTGQVDEVLRQVDILLTPTIPIPAPTIEDETAVAASDSPPPSPLSRLTRPFNLCGVPTITVPCGLTTQGLPVGMQLAGRPFDEAIVLRVAHAYEQSTDWHKRRPPL